MAFIRNLLADKAGTSAVEYGVICGLMVVGLLVGVQSLGAEVANSYTDTADAIRTATAN